MEGVISMHPAVMSAIVGGEGKFHASLLVEPVNIPSNREESVHLLEDIWPTIQIANESCPSFGRILKDCIVFTRAEKPVLRAAKGTVQRKATLQRYQEEIDAISDLPGLPKDLPHGLVKAPEGLHEFLRRGLAAMIPLREDLTDDADLFEIGLESLKVIALSKQITAYLKRYSPDSGQVSPELIYAHSTLKDLEKTLAHLGISTEPEIGADKMQGVFEESLKSLPTDRNDRQGALGHPLIVLMTGSTGSLGSYILSHLALNHIAARIFAGRRLLIVDERAEKVNSQ